MNQDLLKEVTAEQLEKHRPDLVKELKLTPEFNLHIHKDRQRMLAIYRYAKQAFGYDNIMTFFPLLEKSFYSGQSVEEFINETKDIVRDSRKNPAEELKIPGTEKLSHLERARIHQRLNGCGIIDSLRATAAPRESGYVKEH
jgi:hypothetical protein